MPDARSKVDEDLPRKWQAAILEAGQNRPKLRVVSRRAGVADIRLPVEATSVS